MQKQRWEEPERRRKEMRTLEKRKSEKKEDSDARKGRKVKKLTTVYFPSVLWLWRVEK